MEEKPLSWFVGVNLILLFLGGCWMLGSLMVSQWSSAPKMFRPVLLATAGLTNISFLISTVIAFLGMAATIREERAKRMVVYALAIGLLLMMITIALLCAAIASPLSRPALD